MKFWVPWSMAALVAAVALYFFFVGLLDGSVSSFNGALWAGLLAVVALVVGGSLWLRSIGRTTLATLLALVLAIPGVFAALFLLLVVVTQPRWN